MSAESRLRDQIVAVAASLFARGFSVGSAGNISVRLPDGLLVTPTNAALGTLDPARISKLDSTGHLLSGDPPSKEIGLHQAFMATRPTCGAVVHLHSPFATALSCLADTDPLDAIPPITPYVVMRVGKVPVLPYLRPGHPGLGDRIRALGGRSVAVLLANHGSVVSGRDLAAATAAAEELEETARLCLLLRGLPVRRLSPANITELHKVFPAP